MDSLLAGLGESRVAARGELMDGLDSRRYDRLVDGIAGDARARTLPAVTRLGGTGPGRRAGRRARRHRKVRQAGKRSGPIRPPRPTTHCGSGARGCGTRWRSSSPCTATPAREIARLAACRTCWGDTRTRRWPRPASGAGSDPLAPLAPQAVFAMGRMAERYGQRAEELREGFPKGYRKLGARLEGPPQGCGTAGRPAWPGPRPYPGRRHGSGPSGTSGGAGGSGLPARPEDTMDLVLVRHGIAVERDLERWPDNASARSPRRAKRGSGKRPEGWPAGARSTGAGQPVRPGVADGRDDGRGGRVAGAEPAGGAGLRHPSQADACRSWPASRRRDRWPWSATSPTSASSRRTC